jgi:alkylated DNA repair dioxygenase AlkB
MHTAGGVDVNLALETVVAQLSREVQLLWLEEVREVCRLSPLVRPTSARGLPMRVKVTAAGQLGWVGDSGYRYSRTDSEGNSWPPMPPRWATLASQVAGAHPWDSAIVNWYEEGAALGWHCDRAEADTSLLAGRMRNAPHTVERIIPAPLLSPLRNRGRISVTIRVAGHPAA